MNIGPLSLLQRGHSNGEPARHWVVAAWHWRWSITWRWLLWWMPHSATTRPWPIAWHFGKNGGGHFDLGLPIVGHLYLAWQRNMPWHKPCTCHPDDNPPRPCPHKYALSECWRAALHRELNAVPDAPPGYRHELVKIGEGQEQQVILNEASKRLLECDACHAELNNIEEGRRGLMLELGEAKAEINALRDELARKQSDTPRTDALLLANAHGTGTMGGNYARMASLARQLESELEQEHDIRVERENFIQMVAEAFKVESEPHQTFFERLYEAACKRSITP